MIIRKFKHGDIFAVMRLVSEIFQEDYDPAILLDFYNNWHEGFIIAEEGNDIAGLIVGSMPAPNQARILILAVDDIYRHKGIGKMLLLAFTQECMLKGIKVITLEVRVSNSEAIKFYTKFGFSITQTIPHYYKNGEDGYVMNRLL